MDYGRRLNSTRVWNSLARFAAETKDRELAQFVFGEMGTRWDPDSFGTSDSFYEYRGWALNGRPHPKLQR